MFSYCNNNPIGLADNGGSRPMAISDTVESAEDQLYAIRMMAANSLKNAVIGAADTVAARAVNRLKDTKNGYSINRGTAPIYETTVSKYKVPIPKIKSVKKFAKNIGIASAIALGIDIGVDIHDYMGWDIAKAITIDVFSFGLTVGIGVVALSFLPESLLVTAGIYAVGTVISYGSDLIKQSYLKKRS